MFNIPNLYSIVSAQMVRTKSRVIKEVGTSPIIGAQLEREIGIATDSEVKVIHEKKILLEDELKWPLPSLGLIMIR